MTTDKKDILDAIKEIEKFAIAESKLLGREDIEAATIGLLFSAGLALIMRKYNHKGSLIALSEFNDKATGLINEMYELEKSYKGKS